MIEKVKQLAKQVWANDDVRRVVHTFWQTFAAVFLAGISGVVGILMHTRSASAAATALVALVVAAAAAGFSAVKNLAKRWSARS